MKFITIFSAMFFLFLYTQVLPANEMGIPYQKEPRANLTVGGQPTVEQLRAFSEAGYTTVINLRRNGEFDEFVEEEEVANLGMEYIHIPIRNIDSITPANANALHRAISQASGAVLLHCTVGWRAGGLYAIENYLLHDASEKEALDLAASAHMDHATGDVADWIQANGKNTK